MISNSAICRKIFKLKFLLLIGSFIDVQAQTDLKTMDRLYSEARREVEMLKAPIEKQEPHHMYIRLLRDTVAGLSLAESEFSLLPSENDPEILKKIPVNRFHRIVGTDWPWLGMTKIGIDRLNHLVEAVYVTSHSGVAGDFVDTGVWRGGTAAFVFGLFLVNNQTDRNVWLVDKFVPVSSNSLWSDFKAYIFPRNEFALSEYRKCSLKNVQTNFYWLNLWYPSRVNLIPGTRLRSLKVARRSLKRNSRKVAILRVNAENQEETIQILYFLYEFVPKGGWIILDHWSKSFLRKAITKFRNAHGIATPIIEINDDYAYWVKQDESQINLKEYMDLNGSKVEKMENLFPERKGVGFGYCMLTFVLAVILGGEITRRSLPMSECRAR